MPLFFEASIIRRQARTRKGQTIKETLPNGVNTKILDANQLRTSTVIRNVLNLTNPLATDQILYAYSEQDLDDGKVFTIEPGASIAIESSDAVWAKTSGANPVPYEIDQGTE